MADITLSSGSICRPHRAPWGNFPTRTMLISTVGAAAITLGRRVALDWSGSTAAGRVLSSTNAIGAGHFMLAGVSAETIPAASQVGGVTQCTFWEANPLVEFKAATKGGLLASSIVGLHKKIAWDSTLGIDYIDISASTAADWRVVVTDLIDNDGDSGGYVAFRFLSRLTENVASSIAITSTTAVLAFYA